MELKKDERIDDLEINNLKMIQNKNGFCFGIDSILLSDFAKNIKNNSTVLDLGTGTGIIPTLLCAKTKLKKVIGIEIQEEVYDMAKRSLSDFAKNIKNNSTVLDLGTGTGIIPTLLCAKTKLKKVIGIEIQEEVYDMAKRSIKLNKLENKFEIINENIINLNNIFEKNSFDVVVSNPPYKKNNSGIKNEDERKLISRHEIKAELKDFIKVSRDMLKDKGEIYLVHRPERIVDILTLMRENKIEPKVIRFVFSNKNVEPKLVLIKGVKNARPFLKVEKNLYIYNEDGEYTDEVKKIYNK